MVKPIVARRFMMNIHCFPQLRDVLLPAQFQTNGLRCHSCAYSKKHHVSCGKMVVCQTSRAMFCVLEDRKARNPWRSMRRARKTWRSTVALNVTVHHIWQRFRQRSMRHRPSRATLCVRGPLGRLRPPWDASPSGAPATKQSSCNKLRSLRASP